MLVLGRGALQSSEQSHPDGPGLRPRRVGHSGTWWPWRGLCAGFGMCSFPSSLTVAPNLGLWHPSPGAISAVGREVTTVA